MFGEVVEGIDGHRFESALGRLKQERVGAAGHRSRPRTTCASSSRRSRRSTARRPASDFPSGRARAAAPGRAGGLRLVGQPARAGLPPRARHPGRPRHGGQRRADGVRQQGRPLGHRRRVHARPVDRRDGPVRRVPRERAGRGRRRRHSHAAADRGDAPDRCPKAFDQFVETMQRLEEHYRDMQDIEFTVEDEQLYLLQTRAAKRTAAAALKAAVAMVERGADLARGGGRPDRPGPARPAAPPDDRPERGARRRGEGARTRHPARRAAGSSSTPTRPSSARRPGPVILVRWETTPDDIHGMIAAAGDPHRARRHDLARGGRRARDGQAVRRRLRGARRSATASRRSAGAGAARGRRDHDRRRHRPRVHRRGAAGAAAAQRRLRDDPRLGRRACGG